MRLLSERFDWIVMKLSGIELVLVQVVGNYRHLNLLDVSFCFFRRLALLTRA